MKRLHTPDEINEALKLVDAWKDPALPSRQWAAIESERVMIHKGRQNEIAPYRALDEALKCVLLPNTPDTTILDLGAGSGIYREIIRRAGYRWSYEAADYSSHFRDWAKMLQPDINYSLTDATDMNWTDNSVDVLLHGCCLIHIKDWHKAMQEAARVTSKYVIFHRTPLVDGPTQYWLKEAYGVPCFDIWFGREEFWRQLMKVGLSEVAYEPVFETNQPDHYGHYTVVCEKRNA